jgi:hypothetical protein
MDKTERRRQDALIRNLLNQVVDGLQKEDFRFNLEKNIHGDETYTHQNERLDLMIKITGSFPGHTEVEPTFSVDMQTYGYIPNVAKTVMTGVLSGIVGASGLNKAVPYNSGFLESGRDNARTIVACIVKIQRQWNETYPKAIALANKHATEIETLAKEAATFEPVPT